MAIIIFSPTGGGRRWQDAYNWVGGAYPGTADTADLAGYAVDMGLSMGSAQPLPAPLAVIDSVGGATLTIDDGVTVDIDVSTDFTAVQAYIGSTSGGCLIYGGFWAAVIDLTGYNLYDNYFTCASLTNSGGTDTFAAGAFGAVNDTSAGSNVYSGGTYTAVNDSSGGGNQYQGGTFGDVIDANTGVDGYNTYTGGTIASLQIAAGVLTIRLNVTPTDKLSLDGGATWLYNPTGPSVAAAVGATASIIVSGQTIAGVTGNQVVPGPNDVRFGVDVGTTTGVCNVPSKSEVRSGVSVDSSGVIGSPATGTCFVPNVVDVRLQTPIGHGDIREDLSVPYAPYASGHWIGSTQNTTPLDGHVATQTGGFKIAGRDKNLNVWQDLNLIPANAAVTIWSGSTLLWSGTCTETGGAGSGNNVYYTFSTNTQPPDLASYSDLLISVNQPLGTCVVPAAADVRHGTNVDASTGTCYVPAASDVRHGVNVDATTGACYVPTAADVFAGVAVDAGVGTLAIAASDLKAGVTIHGVAGNQVVPAASDVRSGTNTGTTTGTCHVPAAADVRHGVNVDATAGTCHVPAATDVFAGVDVDATVGSLAFVAADIKAGVTIHGITGIAKVPLSVILAGAQTLIDSGA